jgi:hypothetical protein
MTEFMPGAGPPPHKIPSLTAPSFQRRADPGKRTGPGPQNHAPSQIPAARRATPRAASIWLVIIRVAIPVRERAAEPPFWGGNPVAGVAAREAPERVDLCGQVRSGRS